MNHFVDDVAILVVVELWHDLDHDRVLDDMQLWPSHARRFGISWGKILPVPWRQRATYIFLLFVNMAYLEPDIFFG